MITVLWKLLIQLLNCKNEDYVKAIKSNGKVFVVKISKHTDPSEELKKWENALGKPKA